jgi:hypothetical protein
MAEKKIIELEVKNNLGSLKSQLREAQAEVAKLSEQFGVTSKEAANAAKKAAELKDQIEDAKALTDAFNPDAKFKALSSSLGGVASGFAAYQGALGLIGVESKAVEEQLLKVQSAMALADGLQSIGEAKDSFIQLGAVIKNQVVAAFATLRGAIMATGIGLIVTAIAVLLPKIIEWADWTGRAQRKQEDLNDSLERQQSKIRESRKELERDLDFRLRYARALGKSDEELAKIKEGNTKKTNASIYSEIEAARKRLKALREADLGVMASSKEEYNELVKNNRKKREAIVQEIKGLTDNIKRNNEDLLIEQTEQNRKEVDVIVKGSKEKKDAKEREKLEEINTLKPKTADEIVSEERRKREQLAQINKEANEEYIKDLKKRVEDEEQLEKQVKEQKIRMAYDAFSIIQGVADLFAQGNEEDQRKAFQLNKAVNIGQAIMNTAQGVTAALSGGGNLGKVATGLNFVEAGLIGTIGALNIAKIANTQFQGGGNSGGGGATAIPTAPRTPSFDIIQAQPQMQLGALQQQPVKAYVVSGEVSTAQALDRNRVRNATF